MNVSEFFSEGRGLEMETKALQAALLRLAEEVKLNRGNREIFLSYLTLKGDISSRCARLMKIKEEMCDIIKKIEDPICRTLLTYRYINGETMEKTALIMEYDERHIYRLHKKALKLAEEAIKKRFKY